MENLENPAAFPALKESSRFDDNLGRYVRCQVRMSGMSLRDYFAAKAMQTLLTETNLTAYSEVADHAYQWLI